MLEVAIPQTSAQLQAAVERFVLIKRVLNDDEPKAPGFAEWAASLDPDAFIDERPLGMPALHPPH